ncbi:MAG TPA: DUF72 domain-containing protein [Gemmatimonadaceae bacterium]|nr:DUF72 domain-containing protein [Gemmatimonadaceae bacterium]
MKQKGSAGRGRTSGNGQGNPRATLRFGPAGWMYKDWEGIVYPHPKPPRFDQLRYIAEYFDAVEINSTYYGPPPARTATSWVERVKEHKDFRFTAKLWKRFTHERDKAWTTAEVDQVRAGFDVMMESGRLGAVLLQFPWSFRRNEENREWLGDVVRAFKQYPLVVEVRHSSWLAPEFLKDLEEEGVGFVNIDQPRFHDSIGPTAHATSHVGYVRVHGRNYKDWFREKAPVEQRYNYLYPPEELRPWAERAKEIASDPATREVYVVTNNHYKGKAVANALMLQSMVTGATVTAPSGVLEAYGEVMEGYAEPGKDPVIPGTNSLTGRP